MILRCHTLGRAFGLALFFLSCSRGQLVPAIETGTLPPAWITGGKNCLEVPSWQVHEYNPSFLILRQSGCTHYEKPFLYLMFGSKRALLVDTGAGASDAAQFVQTLIVKRREQNGGRQIDLIVSHSHGHGDHTAGDKGFSELSNVTLVPATPEAAQRAFGIAEWPDQAGSCDLGDRMIDVLAIPGHQPAHLAYYDRRTGILLTGDHLYAGRLYVTDFQAYLRSTQRLVDFTAVKPVAHILGCHIEQSSTPFVDYPVGTKYQPNEHSLELGRGHLLELLDGLQKMKDAPTKTLYRDFTIFPRPPR